MIKVKVPVKRLNPSEVDGLHLDEAMAKLAGTTSVFMLNRLIDGSSGAPILDPRNIRLLKESDNELGILFMDPTIHEVSFADASRRFFITVAANTKSLLVEGLINLLGMMGYKPGKIGEVVSAILDMKEGGSIYFDNLVITYKTRLLSEEEARIAVSEFEGEP